MPVGAFALEASALTISLRGECGDGQPSRLMPLAQPQRGVDVAP